MPSAVRECLSGGNVKLQAAADIFVVSVDRNSLSVVRQIRRSFSQLPCKKSRYVLTLAASPQVVHFPVGENRTPARHLGLRVFEKAKSPDMPWVSHFLVRQQTLHHTR